MATTTFTTTAGEDARIVAAFGDLMGLGRNATQSEVKANVVAYVTGVVRCYENRQATASAVAGVTSIAPT